jgi:hypothetical protein
LARPSARRVLGRRVSAGHKNSAASCFCTPAASAPQPCFRPPMRAQRTVLPLGAPWAASGAFTGHQKACWCSCGRVRAGVRGRVNRGLERIAAGAKARVRCLRLPAGAQTQAMGAQQVHDGPGAPQQAFALAGLAVGAVRLAPLRARFWSAAWRSSTARSPSASGAAAAPMPPPWDANVPRHTLAPGQVRGAPRIGCGKVSRLLARAMCCGAFLRCLAVTHIRQRVQLRVAWCEQRAPILQAPLCTIGVGRALRGAGMGGQHALCGRACTSTSLSDSFGCTAPACGLHMLRVHPARTELSSDEH